MKQNIYLQQTIQNWQQTPHKQNKQNRAIQPNKLNNCNNATKKLNKT